MSMVGNDMGDAVAAAMVAAFPGLTLAQIKPAWEVICSAMVTYMKSKMDITVTGVTTDIDQTPASLLVDKLVGTTASGGAWPGAGTLTETPFTGTANKLLMAQNNSVLLHPA